MGSSGSGSFSDYTRTPKSSSGGGAAGGSSGVDKCGEAFHAGLEDVANYEYFANNNSVPPVGTELTVAVKGRVVALAPNGQIVGALPTKFNYLAGCIESGYSYQGVVTASSAGTNPQVEADFGAA